MAVRNTRTGGARKRVAGETKKGGKTTPATKPATKSATRQLMTARAASMVKKMQEKSGPKPTSSKDSEAISRRRPNVINEPQSRPKTPTSKEPATKPAVKKPVPAKERPDNYNQQQISRRAYYGKGTGSK